LTSIGQSVGPVIGGQLLLYFGPERPLPIFGILALLTVLGIPLLLLSQRVHRQTKPEEEKEVVSL